MHKATAQDASGDLSMFFDVSLDMLCIRDLAGQFVKVSRSWEAVLGYKVEELQGMPLLPLVHPDDVPETLAHMRRIEGRDGGEIIGFVNRYKRRDGEYRQLEWRARLSGDKVFAVARDVTERLALEAEREAARQAAEAANQAKTDFLANMSHEIRTPLNGVIGVADALERTELTERQAEMVSLIRASSGTLERLVSDILDVSKVEAGRLELETRAFDLRAELLGPIETYRLRAEAKGLAFQVAYGEAARGGFVGDSTRIRQVLVNLLSNAIKFTAAGEIRVAIDAAPSASDDAEVVTFEVTDTGEGFDGAGGEVLFQRFVQADTTISRRFGGSGLGLSICKGLVELMGGTISAESERGRGSCFRMTLPLSRAGATGDEDAMAAAAIPSAMPWPPGLRILLAEDHPVNQRVIQLLLEPYGVEITTVADGAQAVEALKARIFDLVLMDMQMPVMDGLTATRAIRCHEARVGGGGRTPIIMLSANAMRHHQDLALSAGANLHVAKPITVIALVNGIAQALTVTADRASATA
jgi:PAS domain S-box-containing protein